jgi:hypothetical protein
VRKAESKSGSGMRDVLNEIQLHFTANSAAFEEKKT